MTGKRHRGELVRRAWVHEVDWRDADTQKVYHLKVRVEMHKPATYQARVDGLPGPACADALFEARGNVADLVGVVYNSRCADPALAQGDTAIAVHALRAVLRKDFPRLRFVSLTDTSMTADRTAPLWALYFLKYGETWYGYHFGFLPELPVDREAYQKDVLSYRLDTVVPAARLGGAAQAWAQVPDVPGDERSTVEGLLAASQPARIRDLCQGLLRASRKAALLWPALWEAFGWSEWTGTSWRLDLYPTLPPRPKDREIALREAIAGGTVEDLEALERVRAHRERLQRYHDMGLVTSFDQIIPYDA